MMWSAFWILILYPQLRKNGVDRRCWIWRRSGCHRLVLCFERLAANTSHVLLDVAGIQSLVTASATKALTLDDTPPVVRPKKCLVEPKEVEPARR